jgi:hypothetical protein
MKRTSLQIAIRVPRSRPTLNPNPWANWYRPNPPFFPGVDTPVPVAVSVAVEGGRITVWESVLRVVKGSTVVEEITTGDPGEVITTGGVVIGVLRVTTGGVTTGGVLAVGVTLMVTGLRPDPLHIP